MKTIPFDKYVMSRQYGCGTLGSSVEKLAPEHLNDRRVITAAISGFLAKHNERQESSSSSAHIKVYLSKLPDYYGSFALDENRFDNIWQEDFSVLGQLNIFTNYEGHEFNPFCEVDDVLPVLYHLLSAKEESDRTIYGTSTQLNQASFKLVVCWEMPVNIMNPFLQRGLLDTGPILALQRNHPKFEHHQEEYDDLIKRRLNMQGKGFSAPEKPFSHQEWWDGMDQEERDGWDSLYDRD